MPSKSFRDAFGRCNTCRSELWRSEKLGAWNPRSKSNTLLRVHSISFSNEGCTGFELDFFPLHAFLYFDAKYTRCNGRLVAWLVRGTDAIETFCAYIELENESQNPVLQCKKNTTIVYTLRKDIGLLLRTSEVDFPKRYLVDHTSPAYIPKKCLEISDKTARALQKGTCDIPSLSFDNLLRSQRCSEIFIQLSYAAHRAGFLLHSYHCSWVRPNGWHVSPCNAARPRHIPSLSGSRCASGQIRAREP